MQYTLVFEGPRHIQKILTALGKEPYDQVSPLIDQIRVQVFNCEKEADLKGKENGITEKDPI